MILIRWIQGWPWRVHVMMSILLIVIGILVALLVGSGWGLLVLIPFVLLALLHVFFARSSHLAASSRA